MPTLAVTGATGFVGGHLLEAAAASGLPVRALARRPQAPRANVAWIPGDLADNEALHRLVHGADAVIHIAGVTNARHAADFHAGNAEATARLASVARGLPFLHVSSLAAREPQLSTYGASKAAAEAALATYPGPLVIARPGAVYGPHDHDLLQLFRAASRTGLAPLPAGQRAAYIHAQDLANALLALTRHLLPVAGVAAGDGGARPATYDLADSPAHDARSVAAALAHALGRPVRPIPIPAWALRLGATLETALAGADRLPRLSRDRAAYLAHPDWSADTAPMARLGLWRPRFTLAAGFADTASWYRAHRLL